MLTLEYCRQLDAADPLATLKQQFALPENTIYLDGNSLGARPKVALERATDVVTREWGTDLINSWNKNHWWDLPVRIGNKVAKLVGGKDNEVVVTDTTSSNLFKVLATALRIQMEQAPERKIIIAETEAFPTDLYIIQAWRNGCNKGMSCNWWQVLKRYQRP